MKCIFLGYPHGKKGYLCYDPENQIFYCSQDVKFLEETSYHSNTKTDIFSNEMMFWYPLPKIVNEYGNLNESFTHENHMEAYSDLTKPVHVLENEKLEDPKE